MYGYTVTRSYDPDIVYGLLRPDIEEFMHSATTMLPI